VQSLAVEEFKMKTSFRNGSIGFALGVVASAFVLAWVHRSSSLVRCRTGDLAASVASDAAQSLEGAEYGWIRSARQCDIGEYSVVTPAQSGRNAILVFRNGMVRRPVFTATTDAVNLFEPDGKRGLRGLQVRSDRRATTIFNVDGSGQILTVMNESIALTDTAAKRVLVGVEFSQPGVHRLRYAAYDTSQAAWVENTVGADGKIDLRTTEIPGKPAKTEFRAGERWLEFVTRDGRAGTIVDGQFMSIADAVAKLGSKATNAIRNEQERAALRQQDAATRALYSKWQDDLRAAIPTARIVQLAADNPFMFLSNEADVLREIRAFADTLIRR
jgi:hypothetical protein